MKIQTSVIKVPAIKDLVRWSREFAVLLELNSERTKLYGADENAVDYLKRSSPEFILSSMRRDCEDDLSRDSSGYCIRKRKDGSESVFRLKNPDNVWDEFLTYAECDLVLGSNYSLIDKGYSSPGPEIREQLFEVNAKVGGSDYNAFELGNPVTSFDFKYTIIPAVYYKISDERFKELKHYNFSLERHLDTVRQERNENRNLRQKV